MTNSRICAALALASFLICFLAAVNAFTGVNFDAFLSAGLCFVALSLLV